MAETAANLVDRVLPSEAPVRQWVLSVPRQIRYCLTKDAKLLSGTLTIWMEEVFRHLSRQYAFQKLGVDGRRLKWRYRRRLPEAREVRCGGVTAIQRFGSSMNCHPHFHSLVLDGVYVRDPEAGKPAFIRVPEPDPEDMQIVLARVIRRVTRYLAKQGCFVEEPDGAGTQAEPGVLEVLQAASIGGWEGLSNAARPVPVVGRATGGGASRVLERPFTAEKDGWSIHAGVVVEAGQKEKLEKVCRYLLRPPFAEERLSLLPDGRIAYGFRKPRWDGGTGIVLEPLEFLAKLAALVPPPRVHAVRYHGVLGPHGSVRHEVVPGPQQQPGCTKDHGRGKSRRSDRVDGDETLGPPDGQPRRRTPRIDWATLLRRTFGLDVLDCPQCHGRMRVIATITEPEAIRKVLSAMKLSTEIPRPFPARAPPQGEFEFDQEERETA